jgi:hypothetical protein
VFEKAHLLDYATASGARSGSLHVEGMGCAEWPDCFDFFGQFDRSPQHWLGVASEHR